MKTNDLKKGVRVMLRNGWQTDIVDNGRGITRDAKVFGIYTEIGSVYAHDIVAYKTGDEWKNDLEYTPNQLACKANAEAM